MTSQKSVEIFAQACSVTPGGINTSLRKLPNPKVFEAASGQYLWDLDQNKYVDYHAAFGAVLLGHCHPRVVDEVKKTLTRIDLTGAGITQLEVTLAHELVRALPSAEKVVLCNSGSEATFHAVRLARAITGKQKLLKFQGCYHGWHDYLLMNVLSPAERVGSIDPGSAGMLDAAVKQTIVVPYNDVAAVEAACSANKGEVAAIFVEPVAHNMGCVLPEPGFLQALRKICSDEGILLVFDEVITGFRHGLGGYQDIAGITPDLTTLGKAMGNGFPIAALVGRDDVMGRFETGGGDVFFAGTFNGHPASCAAAIETINQLEDGSVHEHGIRLGARIRDGLQSICNDVGLRATVHGFGSIFVLYFCDGPFTQYEDVLRNDEQMDRRFREEMVEEGVFMLPHPYKRNHVSAAHTDADIDRTLETAERVLTRIARGVPRAVERARPSG